MASADGAFETDALGTLTPPGFGYRRGIMITTAPALVDYPVSISLDTYMLMQNGKMQPDATDLRILDDDANSIEWWNTNAFNIEGEPTTIWFQASVPEDSTCTYYVYYGNPGSTLSTRADTEADIRGLKSENVNMLWRMDEGAGTLVACEGCSYDGSMNDAANWVTSGCMIGDCIDFEMDDSDHVVISGGESWSPPVPGTFEAWIKPEDLSTGYEHFTILSKMTHAAGCSLYPFWMAIRNWDAADRSLDAIFGCDGTRSTDIALEGEWQHFAVTWVVHDGSQYYVRAFLNGEEITDFEGGCDNYVNIPSYGSQPVQIGAAHEFGTYSHFNFDGLMDEVAIFNVAKTPNEIKRDAFAYDGSFTVSLQSEEVIGEDSVPVAGVFSLGLVIGGIVLGSAAIIRRCT